MSFVLCKHCKYVGYCTFAPTGTVLECDEFEDQTSAQSFDWNLQDLYKITAADVDREEPSEFPDG